MRPGEQKKFKDLEGFEAIATKPMVFIERVITPRSIGLGSLALVPGQDGLGKLFQPPRDCGTKLIGRTVKAFKRSSSASGPSWEKRESERKRMRVRPQFEMQDAGRGPIDL